MTNKEFIFNSSYIRSESVAILYNLLIKYHYFNTLVMFSSMECHMIVMSLAGVLRIN